MLGIELTQDLILKFFRFAAVGVTGTMIDFGLTYLSKEVFKTHKYVANAFGFVIAASSNYYLNRIWTFESHSPDVMAEYMRFFLVAVIGLGINTLILHLTQTRLKQNFYVAKVVATGVTLIWNFIGSKVFTFHG